MIRVVAGAQIDRARNQGVVADIDGVSDCGAGQRADRGAVVNAEVGEPAVGQDRDGRIGRVEEAQHAEETAFGAIVDQDRVEVREALDEAVAAKLQDLDIGHEHGGAVDIAVRLEDDEAVDALAAIDFVE